MSYLCSICNSRISSNNINQSLQTYYCAKCGKILKATDKMLKSETLTQRFSINDIPADVSVKDNNGDVFIKVPFYRKSFPIARFGIVMPLTIFFVCFLINAIGNTDYSINKPNLISLILITVFSTAIINQFNIFFLFFFGVLEARISEKDITFYNSFFFFLKRRHIINRGRFIKLEKEDKRVTVFTDRGKIYFKNDLEPSGIYVLMEVFKQLKNNGDTNG